MPEICDMGGLTLDDFTKSRAYREIYREGEARGVALGEATVTLRLLNRRCGPLSAATTAQIEALPLARAQRSSSDALLDLSTLPASASSSGSIKLNLTIDSDAAYRNRLGFVAVEVEELDGVTHYRVGGVAMGNSGAFRDAVLKSSQWVSDSVTGQQNFGGGQASNRFSWDLSLPDRQSNPTASRLFAPVLLNPNGEFYTFGASASDGQQHVKLQGTNIFSFEDLLASQRSDWDFNDVKVTVALA